MRTRQKYPNRSKICVYTLRQFEAGKNYPEQKVNTNEQNEQNSVRL